MANEPIFGSSTPSGSKESAGLGLALSDLDPTGKFGCCSNRLVSGLVLMGLSARAANAQQLPVTDAEIVAERAFQQWIAASSPCWSIRSLAVRPRAVGDLRAR